MRDPRTDPQSGDILRKETEAYAPRVNVMEVISRDRYGIRYKANGTLQSSVDLQAWQLWAKDAEVIYKGEAR